MRLLSLVMCLGLATSLVAAEPIQFQSATNHASLLELYTSEGCSSCPPAEAWLSRLKEHPKLWKDFVPVAFHVDYWDFLGWKDPFASREFSERQRDYAAGWKSRSVYTPGFALNGAEWRGWFNREELPRASREPGGTLTLRSEDGERWLLHFEPATPSGLAAVEFHAALLNSGLSSDVKAGENRGRKLQHDFVVLTLAKATAKRSGDSFQAELSLIATSGITPKRLAVAAWVTPPNRMQPFQAVGGWISLKKSVDRDRELKGE
jgi:hypothetical protein